MKGIFLADKSNEFFEEDVFYEIFSEYNIEKLSENIDIEPRIIFKEQLDYYRDELTAVDFIFSTWGFGTLTETEIMKYFPKLKAVFYAAGSVSYFAKPYLNCGIRIFCSRTANSIPTAEYTLAQILLANKGVFQANSLYKESGYEVSRKFVKNYNGNYVSCIGILGAGSVGSKVIQLLKMFDLDIMVYDPFISQERAKEMGVTLASLGQIFSFCSVISNHLADNNEVINLINSDLLSLMGNYSTYIHTANGYSTNMKDLVNVLELNTTITAVLDILEKEYSEEIVKLKKMDNVFLTPLIAGSFNNEVARMGELMCKECVNYIQGKTLMYEITDDMMNDLNMIQRRECTPGSI